MTKNSIDSLNYEDVCNALLHSIRANKPYANLNSLMNSTWDSIIELNPDLARFRPSLGTQYSKYHYPPFFCGRLEALARECVWKLIFEGILVIGSNASNPDWPNLSLTEWGKSVLEQENNIIPYSDGLVRMVQEQNSIFPDIEFYVEEAIKSFRRGCINSSMVMLGCAIELIAGGIANRLIALNGQLSLNKSDIASLDNWKAAIKCEKILEVISNKRVLSLFSLNNDNVRMLRCFFDPARMTRNEAGHPSGKRFDRNEAYGYFHLFRCYYDNAIEIFNKLHEAASKLRANG